MSERFDDYWLRLTQANHELRDPDCRITISCASFKAQIEKAFHEGRAVATASPGSIFDIVDRWLADKVAADEYRFEDYWSRLMQANHALRDADCRIAISRDSFKSQVEKAFREGRVLAAYLARSIHD